MDIVSGGYFISSSPMFHNFMEYCKIFPLSPLVLSTFVLDTEVIKSRPILLQISRRRFAN